MKKITITAGELLGLENELSDLLGRKLKIKVKLPAMDLQKVVTDTLENVKKIQNELIKAHGEEKPDGRIEVPRLKENGEIHPAYAEFVKEFNEVLAKEYEVEYDTFPIELIEDIESELDYRTLIKLLRNN